MRRKLRVDNRTELAAFVIRKGLTGIDGNTRFVVWEVIWGGANDSTVEEIVLRYQPQDLARPYPELKNRLNRNYSELVPDWKDQFGPVLDAIQAARKTGSVVGFATEVDVPEPIGHVAFAGSAEKVTDDRFLLRLDVQWPEHLDH